MHASAPSPLPSPALRSLGRCAWLASLWLGALTALPAPGATPIDDTVIELPQITVTDSQILPPPEPWNYGRIEGFEVLSNASVRATQRLVRDFEEFHRALSIAWPAARQTSSVPTALIICGRQGKFDDFVPPGESRSERAFASLSFRDAEQSAIVIDLETRTLNLITPETLAAMAAPLSGDGPPVETGFLIDAYRQLYREYIRFLLAQAQPRLPAWLEEGLAQIFMAMDFSSTSIVIGKVEDPNETTQIPEDRDFNVMLNRRALMSMERLLSVPHDAPETRNTIGGTWAKQAYAFVHYCLYGDGSRHQKAFLTFVDRLGREPLSEALFKECFGQTYKQMALSLRGYVQFTNHKYTEFRAKKGERLPPLEPVQLRPATEAEIGRIKGEALRLAGHRDRARLALIAPYIRGERDPQLLAALGLHERETGQDERARRFLEAAATAEVPRPRAHLELARLRYAEIAAGTPGKWTADQSAQVLRPLYKARTLPPPNPEVYELIAGVWEHSEAAPSRGHLAVLDEGVRMFPRRAELVYQAALLNLQSGYTDHAAPLVKLGLLVATTPERKAQFERLQTLLPPEPAEP